MKEANHPNIARAVEFIQIEIPKESYIIMEYIK